jgi:tryptophan halogenase
MGELAEGGRAPFRLSLRALSWLEKSAATDSPAIPPMKNIVIVGGGSAGWMSAIAIADRFPEKHITVVDPKAIGPIGVGESVTGVLLEFVGNPLHGLTMGEFFRRCDATFKMGLWYKNWAGVGTEYLSPIDAPTNYFKHTYPTYTEEFFAKVASEGAKLGDAQFFSVLMRHGKTDHFRNPDGSVNAQLATASCHFDALKFGAWLQEVAPQRPNIEHIDDVVESFEQEAETGHVTKIRTQTGREIAGDFFIDCTGFHRRLFAKVYEPKWKSYADFIKVDSAIPQVVEYAPGAAIPNYTQVTAMPHGWMWQIPTQSRLGKGYIFSSRYVSDEQAIAEFRATGVNVGENPRVLRFEPGRFEKLWIGNVCTIGLSGVFSEPLEATTIHGMSVQLNLLTELLLPFCTRESMHLMAKQYNQLVSVAYDDFVDFINFHYHAGRTDTEFWRDYQKPEAMTPTNRERLERWQHGFPTREDFPPIYTQRAKLTSSLTVWAPMLCAFGLLRREHGQRIVDLSLHRKMLDENVARYLQIRNHVVPLALTQEEAIAYFRQQA